MNKFCSNCGSELKTDSKFCSNCGAKINDESASFKDDYPKVPERNIVTCVILSILTCGIYGIYWFICMTDEVNAINYENGTTGGMAFLFTILTCGIYGLYWAYRMGQKIYEAGKIYNKPTGDNAILYLVLSIFGLGIVNYCLMQNDLNRFSK